MPIEIHPRGVFSMGNSKILLRDHIYGKVKIDSPVIIELINSVSLQRLKKLNQYGIPDELYHLKNHGSRFSHSLGVMILLKKLGASEEEQIAGLAHDISHTAFSHVIDWIFGQGAIEGYQDTKHKEFLMSSDVAKILKKYNFDPQKIADHKKFKLLEREIPDLCADRIDYGIKEFPKKIANFCWNSMTVKNQKIVFKNKKAALLFAQNFLKRQMEHWGGFEAVARYELLAKALKIALKEKIIEFTDLWQDDDFVVKKIKKSKNKKNKKILSVLKNRSLKNLPKGREVAYKKFRYVDPMFLIHGKLLRLSDVDNNFKNEIEKAKRITQQGIILPKINL